MRAERFEDLVAWQKARLLAGAVYEITRRRDFSHDYALVRQMQRAAVSIMSISPKVSAAPGAWSSTAS